MASLFSNYNGVFYLPGYYKVLFEGLYCFLNVVLFLEFTYFILSFQISFIFFSYEKSRDPKKVRIYLVFYVPVTIDLFRFNPSLKIESVAMTTKIYLSLAWPYLIGILCYLKRNLELEKNYWSPSSISYYSIEKLKLTFYPAKLIHSVTVFIWHCLLIFFCPSKVWSMLHHGSVEASSQ